VRFSSTTPTTSGITSPARRTDHGVADAHVLALRLASCASVALLTVVPPTNTGCSLATA